MKTASAFTWEVDAYHTTEAAKQLKQYRALRRLSLLFPALYQGYGEVLCLDLYF